jgi:ribosome-associated protein
MRKVKIDTEFITLGQMLKITDCISSGGHAKFFVNETEIFINDQLENRRGRKLYPGDSIRVQGYGVFTII